MIRKLISDNIRSPYESTIHNILQEHTSSRPEAGLRSTGVFTNPSQQVSIELVPQLIQGTNISSGGATIRDLLGTEKQLCVKELEVFTPVKAGDVNEGMDCCPSEDSLKKNHQSVQDSCFTEVQNQHHGPDIRKEPGSKADGSQQGKCVVDEPRYEKAASIISSETTGLLDGSILQANSDKSQDPSRTVVNLSCRLTCDKTREGWDMNDGQVPCAEEYTQKEGATQPQDPGLDALADEADECQKETPLINETASSLPADIQKASDLQNEKPEVTDGRISPSLYDDRCPTPTLDEEPYQYTPSSAPSSSSSSSSAVVGGETVIPVSPKYPGQIFLFKPKIPHDKKCKAGKAVQSDVKPPLSAPAFMKCTDKFLSAQIHTEECSQIQGADEKCCFQREKTQATSAGKSTISSQSSCLSNKSLQTCNDGHGKPLQTSVEMPSFSLSSVIPANIPKSDTTEGQGTSRDSKIEISKPSKTSTDLIHSGLSEKRTKHLEKKHKKGQIKEGTSKRQTQSLSNTNKLNSGRPNHLPADLLRPIKRQDSSELKRVVQIVEKKPRNSSEVYQEHMAMSHSGADDSDEALVDDTLCRAPQCSLRCTILNSGRKRSSTFLEQMSKRCLEEDLTQASVEKECLIFSEQLKQVLKTSKVKSIHVQNPDAHENLHLFRSSSAVARFCSLQDQEGAEVRLDPPSFVGLKITVDTSERTSQFGIKEESSDLGVGAGCARQDMGKMDDVCAGRKGPVRQKGVRMDVGGLKTEASHLSNPCVKRDSFHKNLKFVVKNQSKTKYRFYLLVTSDDPCFDETKVRCLAKS